MWVRLLNGACIFSVIGHFKESFREVYAVLAFFFTFLEEIQIKYSFSPKKKKRKRYFREKRIKIRFYSLKL